MYSFKFCLHSLLKMYLNELDVYEAAINKVFFKVLIKVYIIKCILFCTTICYFLPFSPSLLEKEERRNGE